MPSTLPHRFALIVALVIATVAVACGGGSGSGPASGPTSDITLPTGNDASDTETVGIVVVEDELILRGHLFGNRNDVGVILSHMRPNDQRDWFEFAEKLADEGYAAFTFDFRGYGESDGSKDFDKLDEDLSEAVRFMRDRGWQKVFLIGASMGGTASLVVAGQEDIAGVVAISAPAQFEGQDALAAVPNISAPKLFVVSEGDIQAADFAELVAAAGAPTDSQTYTGNLHGTNLIQGDSEHAASLEDLILQFLEENGGA